MFFNHKKSLDFSPALWYLLFPQGGAKMAQKLNMKRERLVGAALSLYGRV